MLLWVPLVLGREGALETLIKQHFLPGRCDVWGAVDNYVPGASLTAVRWCFATKVSMFEGGQGDLPPLFCQQLVHLGCAQALKFSPPLIQPISVSAHTRRGAWGASGGVQPCRYHRSQSKLQGPSLEQTESGSKSVALALVLTDAEMHLLCVKSVLVKWLLWDE